jgi:cytochrome d ubiquinol oxidase subunit II
MALGPFLAARTGAPDIYSGLLRPSLVWIVQGATACYAIAAFIALLTRKYKVARIATILQVGLILWGWGLSQSPFLLQGEMTVSAAAPPVLWALIAASAAGLLVLFPSIWYLMQLFKANEEDIPLHE